MSLVDYASSDEDDVEVRDEKQKAEAPKKSGSLPNEQAYSTTQTSVSTIDKLPDASLLLNSPSIPSHLGSCSDHSSRVAAAMAENASRKRESSGSASGFPRSKVPKGSLRHSRNVPDTKGGLLLPPQLKGRSNVVTEDISKLFVKGRANPSSA